MNSNRKLTATAVLLVICIFIAQFSIIFPMFIGAGKPIKDDDDDDNDDQGKQPKDKRNTVFMNYADNLLGNNMPIADLDYNLLWYDGGWVVFGSGTTNGDGLIYVALPNGFESHMAYKIIFLNEWSHIAEITQEAGLFATEIELAVPEITATVYYDNMVAIEGFELDVYHNGVLAGTVITDVSGLAIFSIVAGILNFTSSQINTTLVLNTDVSVSINIIIARELVVISTTTLLSLPMVLASTYRRNPFYIIFNSIDGQPLGYYKSEVYNS